MFKAFESGLLQNEMKEENVINNLHSYLEHLHEISKLHICANHVEFDENDPNRQLAVHYVGRTNDETPSFYYGTFNFVQGIWQPWEKIPLNIRMVGDEAQMALAIWKGSLYLFWLEAKEIEKTDKFGLDAQEILIKVTTDFIEEMHNLNDQWLIEILLNSKIYEYEVPCKGVEYDIFYSIYLNSGKWDSPNRISQGNLILPKIERDIKLRYTTDSLNKTTIYRFGYKFNLFSVNVSDLQLNVDLQKNDFGVEIYRLLPNFYSTYFLYFEVMAKEGNDSEDEYTFTRSKDDNIKISHLRNKVIVAKPKIEPLQRIEANSFIVFENRSNFSYSTYNNMNYFSYLSLPQNWKTIRFSFYKFDNIFNNLQNDIFRLVIQPQQNDEQKNKISFPLFYIKPDKNYFVEEKIIPTNFNFSGYLSSNSISRLKFLLSPSRRWSVTRFWGQL